MATEFDTRFLERRPPPDLTLGSTFLHNDARDISPTPLNGVLKNNPTFSDNAIVIGNTGASVTSSFLIGVEYPIATKTTKQWEKTSISYWLYPSNEGAGGIYGKRPPLSMMYSSANSYASWSGFWTHTLQSSGKPWLVRRYTNNEKNWYVNGGGYVLNQWQHMAMTMDATTNTCKFYLDGVLKTTTNGYVGSTGAIYGNGCEIKIGSRYFTPTLSEEGFNGKISKLLIWEGLILTQAQITDLFNSGRG